MPPKIQSSPAAQRPYQFLHRCGTAAIPRRATRRVAKQVRCPKPTPCWRPQSGKSRGCGGRAPAITPAGAAVHACWLTQDVKRSGPQPFQGEPRGESPPARCPKPTRRNAGLANGPPKTMQGQLRWRLSGGIFGGIDSSVRLEDAKKAAPDVDRGPHALAARRRPDYPLSGCFPAEPNSVSSGTKLYHDG
jgi:hypothetical protein